MRTNSGFLVLRPAPYLLCMVVGLAACGNGTPARADIAAGAPVDAKVAVDLAADAAAPTPAEAAHKTIAAIAKGRCQFILACSKGQYYATEAGCLAILADEVSSVIVPHLQDDLASGAVVIDAVQEAMCTSDSTVDCGLKTKAACEAVITGHLADGAACTAGHQCTSGNCRKEKFYCATGTCLPTGNLGDACSWAPHACKPGLTCAGDKCVADVAIEQGKPCSSSSQCAQGAYCRPQGNDLFCATKGEPGGACQQPGGCNDSAYCDMSKSGMPQCVTKAKAGEACAIQPYEQDYISPCDAGLRCMTEGPGKGSCQVTVGVGAACVADDQCLGLDLLCTAGSGGPTCATLPGKGQSCTESGNLDKRYRCVPPYSCVGGVCVDMPGLGQPRSDRCAGGAVCNEAKVCAPPPSEGEVCTSRCAAGLACSVGKSGPGHCVQLPCN